MPEDIQQPTPTGDSANTPVAAAPTGQLTPEQLSQANSEIAQPTGQLTPEQLAQANQETPPGQPTGNIIQSGSVDDLVRFQHENPEFNLVQALAARPDLQNDPAIIQKSADALARYTDESNFKEKIPSFKDVGTNLWSMAKGYVKTGAMGLGAEAIRYNPILMSLRQFGIGNDLGNRADRIAAEIVAGNVSSLQGLSDFARYGSDKIGRNMAALRGRLGLTEETGALSDLTPDARRQYLFDRLADQKTLSELQSGTSPLYGKNYQDTVTNLSDAGLALRPEEIQEYAGGSPLSLELMGKAFGGASKVIGEGAQAIPGAARVTSVIETALPKAVGTAIQLPAIAAEKAGELVEKHPLIVPLGGLIAGAAQGIGEAGAGAGLGTILRPAVEMFGKRGGAAMLNFGKALASETPSGLPLIAKDILQSAPGAAFDLGMGALMDAGMIGVADTPDEAKGAGMGTLFGILGGAARTGFRTLSGQIIAPRDWGTAQIVPSNRYFPTLEGLANAQAGLADAGTRTRLNAVRGFLRAIAPNYDALYVGGAPATGEDPLVQKLVDLGLDQDTAKLYSQQRAVTLRPFVDPMRGGADAKGLVLLRDIDSAPHETRHVMSDVLGNSAATSMWNWLRTQYSPETWDQAGNFYAQSAATADRPFDPASQSYQDYLADVSGWGKSAAAEKLASQIAQITDRPTKSDMAALLSSPEVQNGWRDIIGPDATKQLGDNYIADEIAAENWDALFKHTGPRITPPAGVLPKMASLAGSVMSRLGIEPLSGRVSEGQGVPLKQSVTARLQQEALQALQGKQVVTEPPKVPGKPLVPGTPEAIAYEGEKARNVAASAPTAVSPGAAKSQREILGTIAEAIAKNEGVQIDYRSAPPETAAGAAIPGAAVAPAKRGARRALIELFRDMPEAARALMPKIFKPLRLRTTSKGIQVNGYAPQVLAANAQKLAGILASNPEAAAQFPQYSVDPQTKSFTPEAWTQFWGDVNTFVRNQLSGHTGAGEPLVVPKAVTKKKFYQPPVTGPGEGLDQTKADIINMLFGIEPQSSGKVAEAGTLPLSAAGQLVSEATKPGRLGESRVAFGEGVSEAQQKRAEELGLLGVPVREVNPVRNWLTQKGLVAPKETFIEALQWLNAEHMADANLAPEQPTVQGNTLTLQAGFAPRKPNPDVAKVAEDYLRGRGMPVTATGAPAQVNPDLARRLADFYQAAPHTPQNPDVKKSYDALTNEITQQYQKIREAGYNLEPWTGAGEPYANSAAMMEDVRNNKHLFFNPTQQSFSGEPNNLMLRPSGIPGLVANDAFRGVHDFFGHAKEGYQFGPQGEYNAWLEHSKMFSPAAQGALAAETLAKNSWVNFGSHLKGTESATEKPFAEQKNTVVPPELISEAKAQFAPDLRPRAVKTAAVRDEATKKVYEGPFHGGAMLKYLMDTQPGMSEDRVWDALSSQPNVTEGFTTHEGEFLTRDEADARAQEMAQMPKGYAGLGLESTAFERYKKLQEEGYNIQSGQFQPRDIEIEGPDGKKYKARFDGYQDFSAIKPGMIVPQITALEDLPGASVKHSTTYGPSLTAKGYKIPDLTKPVEISPAAQFSPSPSPRAVVSAAVQDNEGDIWTGSYHGAAIDRAQLAKAPAIPGYSDPSWDVPYKVGFVTREGEFLDRNAAFERGKELGQIPKDYEAVQPEEPHTRDFKSNAAFSPAGETEKIPKPEQIDRPVTMIVRHGSTKLNDPDPEKDLIRGWKDVPLDKKGLAEADETAGKLKPYGIQTVVTSDLKRAKQTADAIAKETGARVIDEPGFRPWHLGPTVEGKPTQEMLPVISDYAGKPDQVPPGGESFNQFKDRFLDAFHRTQDSYPDQNTAIVTHYRGAKLLDAWRRTGVDNDTVDMAAFEKYDPSIKPSTFEVIDKTGAQFSPQKRAEEEKNLPLVHFSNIEGLKTLEPEFHGTGLAGAERQRAKEYPELYVPRTYLGTQDYKKEGGLGDVRYRAEMRAGKLYDVDNDPNDLYPSSTELEQAGYAPMDRKAALSLYEKRIRDAGFEGYLSKDNNAVAKFTPTPVTQFQVPKAEDFKNEKTLPEALKNSRYAILTATQESKGKGTDEVNKLANENLEKALISDGYNPIPLSGNYKGVDQGQSFIVPGMSPEEAARYGKLHNQESVLIPQGLLYPADNSLLPAQHDKTVVGPAAEKQDFYSKPEGGGPAFSVGLDFAQPKVQFHPGLPKEKEFEIPHGEVKGPVPVAITAPKAARSRLRQPEEGNALSVDYVNKNPDMDAFAKKVVDHFKKQPGFKNIDTSDTKKALQDISKRLQSNIEFIYDKTTPEEKARWRQWYDLAKRMTEEWAPEFEQNPDLIAALNAKLSPQTDWNRNVTMTRRVLETIQEDPKFTEADRLFLQEKFSAIKSAKDRKAMEDELAGIKEGQRMHELNDWQAGMLLRAHNELTRTMLTHDHELRVIPGEVTGWGKPFDDLRSVMSIYRNPSPENVSQELGGNHKVRSFYNNHVSPESPDWTTIDTHAVAAANLFPYGGSDDVVKKNFGGIKHTASGYRGTYFLYQDAYAQAAKKLGILPRELQSIVWEKMRQVLSPEGKRMMQREGFPRVEKIHQQMDDGKISPEAGREKILQLFEDANSGSWSRPESQLVSRR